MKKLLYWLSAISSSILLVACGGGGGGGSSSSSGTTYTSSGSVGEVLNFTVNTTVSPPTYSYTIVQSSYGLTNQTGSGTLTANANGSYIPSGSPNSIVYPLPNGLLVGGLKLNLAGTQTVVPLLGMSSPVTSLSSLAGTYNYISTACSTNANGYPTSPNCATSYGTIKINTNGTFTQCTTTNITTTPGCSTTAGTVASQSSGIWEFVRTGSANKNYLIASTASNGQIVLAIDFNDAGGYGYGHAIASTQPTTAFVAGSANGTWFAHANNNSSGVTVVSGTSFNSVFTTGNNSGTLTFDNPWSGIVRVVGLTDTGFAILAGTGVYVYRSNSAGNTYYELGVLGQ
jgi:hypothetical protein